MMQFGHTWLRAAPGKFGGLALIVGKDFLVDEKSNDAIFLANIVCGIVILVIGGLITLSLYLPLAKLAKKLSGH
jgi:hypothetical protein